MSNKDSMFSMSLDDGRIVFRNEQVDNQINYHPVPYDIAWKVDHKELDWKLVKEACEKKIKEKGELTLQEYLQKLKLLNVRKTKVDLKDEEEIYKIVLALCEQVSYRLRCHDLVASTVNLQLRNNDFKDISHQKPLSFITSSTAFLYSLPLCIASVALRILDEATRPIAFVRCNVESTLFMRTRSDFISAPILLTSAFRQVLFQVL
jgi:hypothetical protein